MEYEEDLQKLESNVEKMLNNLDSVQEEKIRLQADLACLRQDKEELEEQIKRMKDEKKSILQRVSGLLGSMEKWEKTAAVETGQLSLTNTPGKGPSEPVQGVLIGN